MTVDDNDQCFIKRNHLFSTVTVAFLGHFFIILALMETGMNTPQSHVIYLLNCSPAW